MTEEIAPEKYKYVLAMDPGGTTGIAMLRYTDETAPELVYLYQIPNGKHGFWEFFDGSRPTDNVDIVSENFTIRQGVHGADVTPLYIEGIQFALWGDEVTYQEPAMKSLVPDEWLKEQNLWTPGHRHQMDALIHALVFLRNEMHEPTLKALSNAGDKPLAKPGEAEEKTMSLPEPSDETGEAEELSPEEVQKLMEAMAELFGGEEPDRSDEEPQQGSAEAQGQAGDGDEEGEPTGGGGRGEEMDEVPEPEVAGVKRRRRLNGSFSGFDED